MRYVTPSGRSFVLAHYSLAEWAEMRHAALIYLGCSPEYAARERAQVAQAVRPEPS